MCDEQVLELFAEQGWRPFASPGETYEFLSASGAIHRMEITVEQEDGGGVTSLCQRNALFDACLESSLAHVIVSFIGAKQDNVVDLSRVSLDSSHVSQYALKDPIAVQQWVSRRLETIQGSVKDATDRFQGTGEYAGASLSRHLRHLSGLSSVAFALLQRLREGSRHVSDLAGGASRRVTNGSMEERLEDTELERLTTKGQQHLLELIYRIRTVENVCKSLLFLEEHEIKEDEDVVSSLYDRSRKSRESYRTAFDAKYGVDVLTEDGRGSGRMLIELLLHHAGVEADEPPFDVASALELLWSSSVQEDVVSYYADEVDRVPLANYFRVPVALVLYFFLDFIYVSQVHRQSLSGDTIVDTMKHKAQAFAATLGVQEDMKWTLLALWLVENATSIQVSSEQDVQRLYIGAITALQQASATHTHRLDLEPDLIQALLETVVYRQEYTVAWHIWNVFGLQLSQLPRVSGLLAIVSLERGLWERGLSIAREQGQGQVLPALFQWLEEHGSMTKFIKEVTLRLEEEEAFHSYMLEDAIADGPDVQENSRRVDLLVMYYILRSRYNQAWRVHRQHESALENGTSMHVRQVLEGEDFRTRVALLENAGEETEDGQEVPSVEDFRYVGGLTDAPFESDSEEDSREQEESMAPPQRTEDMSLDEITRPRVQEEQEDKSQDVDMTDYGASFMPRSTTNFGQSFATARRTSDASSNAHSDLSLRLEEAGGHASASDSQAQSAYHTLLERPSSTDSRHSSEAGDKQSLQTPPKRFAFVQEPVTDSRVSSRPENQSPGASELDDAMELEPIDEEFSTPSAQTQSTPKEVMSEPVRRNPRRSARRKY